MTFFLFSYVMLCSLPVKNYLPHLSRPKPALGSFCPVWAGFKQNNGPNVRNSCSKSATGLRRPALYFCSSTAQNIVISQIRAKLNAFKIYAKLLLLKNASKKTQDCYTTRTIIWFGAPKKNLNTSKGMQIQTSLHTMSLKAWGILIAWSQVTWSMAHARY